MELAVPAFSHNNFYCLFASSCANSRPFAVTAFSHHNYFGLFAPSCTDSSPCISSVFTRSATDRKVAWVFLPHRKASFQNISGGRNGFQYHHFTSRCHVTTGDIAAESSGGDEVELRSERRMNSCLPFLTLEAFPREELIGKVVMVRFDSKLCSVQDKVVIKCPNQSALNTFKYLCNAGARVVLVSHLSASKNSANVLQAQFFADFLSVCLEKEVTVAQGVIGDTVAYQIEKLKNGDILLLGDLSRYREEAANCMDFARRLSARIDILVNDTFAESHRVLASTVGVARFTYARIAGFHLAERLSLFTGTLERPKHPFIVIIGGAKILEKTAALRSLLCKCDKIAFVGVMAFTFLYALGLPISPSLVEKHALGEALELLEIAKKRNVMVLLPKDFWCINDTHACEPMHVLEAQHIKNGWRPVDIGPTTMNEIASLFVKCKAYLGTHDWTSIFSDPSQPLAVDIGSGNGLFVLKMAQMFKHLNFLGLEINRKLVNRSIACIQELEVVNGHFILANATTTFRSIVSDYPGSLLLVSIQCPNPHFNDHEQRWRMVQRSLVESIADILCEEGKVFLQSDVKEVAVRMKHEFLWHGKGKLAMSTEHSDSQQCDAEGWLMENPFAIFSDWEQHVIDRGKPMYRVLLSKCTNSDRIAAGECSSEEAATFSELFRQC